MLNWDDLKFFLAVCRTGSVRAAAQLLGVNHATVSRRINSFELSLGQRLFDRSAKGYVRTKLGDEIFNEASYLEDRLNTVERKIAGKDENLAGDIRITMPDLLAQKLFMPAIAEFCRLYPAVELDFAMTNEPLNLANREADVAIRVCSDPPEYLIGRKLAEMHRAPYVAKSSCPKVIDSDFEARFNWIGWTDKVRRPVGKLARDYPRFSSKHKLGDTFLQAQFCALGMGVSILPCFVGDPDPALVRIPPYSTDTRHDIWILSHPDLRKNAKIQAFVRHITEFSESVKPLIEGQAFTPS